MTTPKPLTAEMAKDVQMLKHAYWPEGCEGALSAIASGQHVVVEAGELERLRADAAAVHALQRALFFWLPACAGGGDERAQRCGDDSMLLMGADLTDAEFNDSAEMRGWIVAPGSTPTDQKDSP